MKIILPRNLASGLALGVAASLLIAVAAWAGFTGPDRTTTSTEHDVDGDQWYCRQGSSTCYFATHGDGGQACSGSHPSTGAQLSVCGWIADSCGCNEGEHEVTVSLPPATVGGSEQCDTPGNNGWCRGGASIALSADEPVGGEVIEMIEGSPGGVLCDPADASSISCSWSGGGQGSFSLEFWAVSSLGDTSEKSSADWRLDSEAPSIDLNVPGGSGWNRGGSYSVTVSGADATSGVDVAQVKVDGGSWSSSAQVSGDGTHSVSGRVIDQAGNQSTASGEIKIDGTPPSVEVEISGTHGNAGWFISPVTVSADASDALSGVAGIEVSLDGGAWQDGPLVVSTDGTHSIRVRASDHAGNQSNADGPTVQVDAHPPQSVFIEPPNKSQTWVSGLVELHGTSVDFASGLDSVEISFDIGASWEPLELRGMEWSASWDTSGMPSGSYPVLARARDIAGHLESSAEVTLLIDSLGPTVDIPDAWLVNEQAPLTIRDGETGLAQAIMVVGDGLLEVELDVEHIPETIAWDGVLPDGQSAEPGEYAVRVTAWDMVGNTGQDIGMVIVPEPAERPETPPQSSNEGDIEPASSGSTTARAEPESIQPLPVAPLTFDVWLWPALAWLGLVGTIGFAKLLDPRPGALSGLRRDLRQIRKVMED